jgi:hypothetical protein
MDNSSSILSPANNDRFIGGINGIENGARSGTDAHTAYCSNHDPIHMAKKINLFRKAIGLK